MFQNFEIFPKHLLKESEEKLNEEPKRETCKKTVGELSKEFVEKIHS